MAIFTIKKIPTITSISNNIYISPSKLAQLTDRQLLKRYGLILVAITAQRRSLLDYKISQGHIICNIESYFRPLFEEEFKRRNLFNENTFFIEIGHEN